MFVNVLMPLAGEYFFGFSNFYIEIVMDGFSLSVRFMRYAVSFFHLFLSQLYLLLIEFQLKRTSKIIYISQKKEAENNLRTIVSLTIVRSDELRKVE